MTASGGAKGSSGPWGNATESLGRHGCQAEARPRAPRRQGPLPRREAREAARRPQYPRALLVRLHLRKAVATSSQPARAPKIDQRRSPSDAGALLAAGPWSWPSTRRWASRCGRPTRCRSPRPSSTRASRASTAKSTCRLSRASSRCAPRVRTCGCIRAGELAGAARGSGMSWRGPMRARASYRRDRRSAVPSGTAHPACTYRATVRYAPSRAGPGNQPEIPGLGFVGVHPVLQQPCRRSRPAGRPGASSGLLRESSAGEIISD